MKLSDLDFEYPEDLVATTRAKAPAESGVTTTSFTSRTLLVDSAFEGGQPREIDRESLLALFRPGDLWVVNETRVLKRRVFTNEGLEILFIRPLNEFQTEWEVLCPSSRWKQAALQSVGDVTFELIERGRTQKVRASRSLDAAFFEKLGELPLPPYIQKARGERHARTEDDAAYQSIWAINGGSLAAPTASFHFDEKFMEDLASRGVDTVSVTLHVGLGTFLPVTVENLADHVMHAEQAEIPKASRDKIAETKKAGGRIVAIGTTVTRTLEAMALGHFSESDDGTLRGETTLLIRPGHEWKIVDVLLTNFHQPKSTLFALVAAFASLETARAAYQWAIAKRFRLFSYGDLTVWL